MTNRANKKKTALLIILICLIAAVAPLGITQAAYYAKGKFKDVFVNKKEYFSSDILYSITDIEDDKQSIGSSGRARNFAVYNHDVMTGDFNAFDVYFDVYAWLDGALPDGKAYTLSYYDGGVKKEVQISSTEHAAPVVTGRRLEGGRCSTETFTVTFCYEDGEDVTGAPGLTVVAVPTEPKRLSTYLLGSVIKPTWSEAYSVIGTFEEDASGPGNYAAFTYRVVTMGSAPENGKITIRWKSDCLTLMTKNNSIEIGEVKDVSENGFDKKIEWTAKSNRTDVFVFFRAENAMWDGSVTWEEINALVETEFTKSA